MTIAQTDIAPRYELVVFDWDGTVMDTTALIALGIQHAAKEMGYTVPTYEAALSVIGLDWRSALLKVVPDCPESLHLRFNEIYRAWYIPARSRGDSLSRHARTHYGSQNHRLSDGRGDGQKPRGASPRLCGNGA